MKTKISVPEYLRKDVSAAMEERVASVPYAPTLNGKPARVTGFAKPFATVTELSSGLSAQWTWEAVKRIMERDGAFRS